ncbi:MAG TPA: GTP-binding protein [Candidatus Paceibacterota bacterium]|nr:GTP-binding protein [Candidatus Paceibacterota bacterium]
MIPVTILTGFLGSGKTTLLNRVLTAPHGRRIAVIVNEFGDIGLDQKFIARAEGDIVELTNGCVCCSARNDTVEILLSLVARAREGHRVDHVVIETTGLAKPAALARFFLADSPLRTHYRLDGVITLVDAFHGTSQLIQYREVKEQVGVADLIVLNKTDLTEEPQLTNLREWLRGINPVAPILTATHGDVPLERVLDIGGFDLAGKHHLLDEHGEHEHVHDADIVAVSIREERPLDRGRFTRWLAEFVAMDGADLLRYKGIIAFAGSEHRAILQGVHMINELSDGGPWPAGESPLTELVFIGRRLLDDVINEGVRNAVAR